MASSDRVIKVHVVDDDPADFMIIDELLQESSRCRFQINHISSSADARQELIDPSCDVFLIDYFLGAVTARDLLLEARKVHCTVPLIVLTGMDSGEIDDEVIDLGASDFLPKAELSKSILERTIWHAIQHKQSELALEKMVKRDPLTGLGNRLLFEEILERSLALCKRHGTKLAVLFMDLDRFKEINDSLGHPTGDMLLLLIADRLRAVIREADFVARIGGDEFTVLIEDLQSTNDALMVARKIISAISEPSAIGGHDLNVSASIGMALYPDNGDTPIKLMQKADIALYEAKRKGLNQVQCFTANLQTRLEKYLDIERGLRFALENDQFELHLQPQWSLASRDVFGFEALIRWKTSSGQLISPAEFIPVAEKTGLILPIGEWLTRKACEYLKDWSDHGASTIRLSINVSPVQLKSGHFIEMLEPLLLKSGVRPELLEIEITEESLLEGGEEDRRIQKDLRRIRELGVKLAIDDFGTGYSSLRYLSHFPADVVKIDKSFVSSGSDFLSEPAICKAVITMADSLGMDVIAEGIETETQLQQLHSIGCANGQGYLVSKPLPFDEACQWVLNVKKPQI